MSTKSRTPNDSSKLAVQLVCICAFLVSIGINFTRVPIIYAFRLMTCEEYYRHNPAFRGQGDRCNVPSVEASTASAISLLGATITVNGVVNIMLTNWCMRKFASRTVLILQLIGPTARLACQLLGVRIGGHKGVVVVQISQLLGVVGGSTGYALVLTTLISRVVNVSEQTPAFSKLQGAIMLGTAAAHLLGGITSDALGVAAAFQIACLIMITSLGFATFALPGLSQMTPSSAGGGDSLWTKTSAPFRVLLVTKTTVSRKRNFQRPLLALSVFSGVLATGFIPILLQMHATNSFGFKSQQNGFLMFITYGVRSLFLTLAFPVIVEQGRRYFQKRESKRSEGNWQATMTSHANESGEYQPLRGNDSPANPACPVFELRFLTASFFLEAILTAGTALCFKDWHLYIAAGLLPLASASPPAANGFIASICEPWEKVDALTGIAMMEMLGNVLTMTIFGFIYSYLAEMGRSNYVFVINGGLSLTAALIAMLIKDPSNSTSRFAVSGSTVIKNCNTSDTATTYGATSCSE